MLDGWRSIAACCGFVRGIVRSCLVGGGGGGVAIGPKGLPWAR